MSSNYTTAQHKKTTFPPLSYVATALEGLSSFLWFLWRSHMHTCYRVRTVDAPHCKKNNCQ